MLKYFNVYNHGRLYAGEVAAAPSSQVCPAVAPKCSVKCLHFAMFVLNSIVFVLHFLVLVLNLTLL